MHSGQPFFSMCEIIGVVDGDFYPEMRVMLHFDKTAHALIVSTFVELHYQPVVVC